jgi:DNA-binding CsgD family transcriptional regulator/tetratricopeptide (TPR) repeat protein
MATADVQRGRDALARGAWEEARDAFDTAAHHQPIAEAFEGLGDACWWLNDGPRVFEAREEAYRRYHERGDRASAARIALWLYWDYRAFRSDAAVSSGWLHRAERLLEGLESTREYGWLRYRQAEAALFGAHDPAAARQHTAACRAVGRALHLVDLDIGGLALEGLAFVTGGDPAAGRHCLDEAMTAIIGGELTDLPLIGQTSCHLIAACERMHDYDRAAQWCERLKAFTVRWRIPPLFAICRTLYAGLCLSRGTWNDAEVELSAAASELSATMPGGVPEAITRLGELRRRQGRVAEAAGLFAQTESHPRAVLGRAALAFDQDQPAAARELVDRYLRRMPPADCAARAAALDLLARIAAALSDTEAAIAARDELAAIADKLNTDPLRAMAASSRALVAMADGEWETARASFEDAVDLFTAAGMPFEAARARMDRAGVLERAGRREDAIVEAAAGRDGFTSLGAAGEAARAAAMHSRLESRPGTVKQPISGAAATRFDLLTARERDVLKLVGDGLSNPDIARRLGLSEHTVHRHISNILTKLDLPSRTAAAAAAARSGAI